MSPFSSTPSRLLGALPHSRHQEIFDMGDRTQCAGDGSRYISPDAKRVEGGEPEHWQAESESNDTTKNITGPKPYLGAQTTSSPNYRHGWTLARTTSTNNSLLPTVLSEALDSRTVNASSFSQNKNAVASVESHAHFSDASAFLSFQMRSRIDYWQTTSHMDDNMNTTENAQSQSFDQSQNAREALAQPSLIMIDSNEKSEMTNHNARAMTDLLSETSLIVHPGLNICNSKAIQTIIWQI